MRWVSTQAWKTTRKKKSQLVICTIDRTDSYIGLHTTIGVNYCLCIYALAGEYCLATTALCKKQSLFWHSYLFRHSRDAFDQICAKMHDCTQLTLVGACTETKTEGRGVRFRFVLVCASLDFEEEQNQLERLERWLFSTWWNNLVAQLSPRNSWPHLGLNYATSAGRSTNKACLSHDIGY